MSDISNAAAWLDYYRPGWFNEIDLNTLDQDYGLTCVLGQLYGSYGSYEAQNAMQEYGSAHPFDGDGPKDTEEWKQQIMIRRQLQQAEVTAPPRAGMSEIIRTNILYCVDTSDLDLEVKDAIYKELYSL